MNPRRLSFWNEHTDEKEAKIIWVPDVTDYDIENALETWGKNNHPELDFPRELDVLVRMPEKFGGHVAKYALSFESILQVCAQRVQKRKDIKMKMSDKFPQYSEFFELREELGLDVMRAITYWRIADSLEKIAIQFSKPGGSAPVITPGVCVRCNTMTATLIICRHCYTLLCRTCAKKHAATEECLEESI